MITIRQAFNNKFFQLSLAFVLGGVITVLFLQETVIKKKNSESKKNESSYLAQITAAKSETSNLRQQLSRTKHQVIYRTTKPDGTKVEIITTDTNTDIITKVRSEEQSKYQSQLDAQAVEFQHKLTELSVHKNPKRFSIFGGYNPLNREAVGGFNYTIWGPLTLGAVTTHGFYPTLGIIF